MASSKHKALSLSERMIAKTYGVHPSAISRILKQKDQIIDAWQNNTNLERKRKRTGKAEDVEEALLCWFSQARSRQLPVSGPAPLKLRANGAIQIYYCYYYY